MTDQDHAADDEDLQEDFDDVLDEVRSEREIRGYLTQIASLEHKLADTRRERDARGQTLRKLTADLEKANSQLDILSKMVDLDPSPPSWVSPSRAKTSARRAILTTILSDSHFDEVVNPDEIGGVNAYDRDIATLRLRRYFEQLVFLGREYMSGVSIDGVVLMLGGDLLSGDIHEELTQTNEDTMLGSVLYWTEQVSAGIDMLAEEYGDIFCPVVVGNHGRRTRKNRSKLRAKDNFDWLFGQMVARDFKDREDVTFQIPEAAHVHFDVYDTTYRLEHGDSARGGGGWIGAIGPVMKREQKVRTATQAMEQEFDHMVIGHWHQLSWLSGVTVNGSNKGYDEYASTEGFGFEEPKQGAWLTTPEKGITLQGPVFVMDKKKESW